MGTMASSTHQFGVLDLIRAGLQDLDTARTLLDELRADGIDDDRLCLLMKTLEQTCEPDIALRNLVDNHQSVAKAKAATSTRSSPTTPDSYDSSPCSAPRIHTRATAARTG